MPNRNLPSIEERHPQLADQIKYGGARDALMPAVADVAGTALPYSRAGMLLAGGRELKDSFHKFYDKASRGNLPSMGDVLGLGSGVLGAAFLARPLTRGMKRTSAAVQEPQRQLRKVVDLDKPITIDEVIATSEGIARAVDAYPDGPAKTKKHAAFANFARKIESMTKNGQIKTKGDFWHAVPNVLSDPLREFLEFGLKVTGVKKAGRVRPMRGASVEDPLRTFPKSRYWPK